MKFLTLFFATLIFLNPLTLWAEGFSQKECSEIVKETKKSLPIRIDDITIRVNVSCTRGVTKTMTLTFFDEISTQSSQEEWKSALADQDKKAILFGMYCSQKEITDLLRSIDLGFSYRVNGGNVGELRLTEKLCSEFLQSKK